VDYQGLLYGPVYSALGVAAVLHMDPPLGPLEDGDVPITAIDKTAGITINAAVDLQTTLPAATVLAADLIAAGVDLGAVDGRTLTLNGKDWRIASLEPKPSPNGQDDGEIYFLLDGGLG
jgi:hypothetical protein